MPGDPLEGRQVRAGQLTDRTLEHHRSEQRLQAGGGRPGLGRRGGEPESQGRDRHLEDLVLSARTEMMGFVHDQQTESIADARHVAVGARERGHGQRRKHALAVAEATDGPVPDRGQRGQPLGEQRARGHETQARRPRGHDGAERDLRLAAPRRQRDHAPPPASRQAARAAS